MSNLWNEIQKIRITEKRFYSFFLETNRTDIIELNIDSIVTYHYEMKSKKKLDLTDTSVPEETMKEFFADVYDFIRNIQEATILENDTCRKFVINYYGAHTEIFEDTIIGGKGTLDEMIYSFIDKTRKSNYFDSLFNKYNNT